MIRRAKKSTKAAEREKSKTKEREETKATGRTG